VTRTFVAILVSEAWMAYLARVARELKEATDGFSWVKPENVHVTVRFLGDLEDDGVARARESVRRSASPLRAPVARLGRLGAFPSPDRPRVVWVGLSQGEEEVKAIAKAVDRGLERDGFGRSDKPSRAHLTVARARDGARGFDDLARVALPDAPPAEPLRRVTVMKSELHPSGARYNALEEVRLLDPAG